MLNFQSCMIFSVLIFTKIGQSNMKLLSKFLMHF